MIKKVAHTRLPGVGFRSWSRFLAVSLHVMWVINQAVRCHYFQPGLQLPPQSFTLTAGFMTRITCRLTAKNRDQLQNPTLGNRVWATVTFFYLSARCDVAVLKSVSRSWLRRTGFPRLRSLLVPTCPASFHGKTKNYTLITKWHCFCFCKMLTTCFFCSILCVYGVIIIDCNL